MKFSFGNRSKKELETVKKELRAICKRALSYGVMDATVVQGRRSKEEQNEYYDNGKSKLKWPNSKHNVRDDKDLARAVDVVPYVNGKVSWNQKHCLVWAGLMLGAASELGIAVRWGGNWDCDGEVVTDQRFNDLVHFELREK